MRGTLVFFGAMLRVLVLLLTATLPTAHAANLAAEARLVAAMRADIPADRLVDLEAGGLTFVAIHRLNEREPRRGAAILLHDRGLHADTEEVVRPLAIELARHGWETLAVQLPVAGAGAPERDWQALVDQAQPRLQAAADFLLARDVDSLAVVGHGLGAAMAARFVAGQANTAGGALVLIGAPQRHVPDDLPRVTVPTLDMFGERDARARDGAVARRLAAGDAYTQVEIPGVDHRFTAAQALLASRVRAWLNRVAGTDAPAGGQR
jgi:pimeloyl-ACP methyl ester carboxylesterase